MSLVNVLSGTVFLTNAISARSANLVAGCALSCLLTVTSWTYHATKNRYIGIVDKCVVFSMILHGCYRGYKTWGRFRENLYLFLVGSLSLGVAIFMFVYGYYTKSLCYHPEYSKIYHALMHGFSSLSHHCALLL
jgi:hypothetical protein